MSRGRTLHGTRWPEAVRYEMPVLRLNELFYPKDWVGLNVYTWVRIRVRGICSVLHTELIDPGPRRVFEALFGYRPMSIYRQSIIATDKPLNPSSTGAALMSSANGSWMRWIPAGSFHPPSSARSSCPSFQNQFHRLGGEQRGPRCTDLR
jgi:hypothetical protein